MNTLTYATSNVPSKDVLAISSLLSLFERRLSAKWLMRNHPPGQSIDVLVVDVDRPGGAEALQEAGGPRIRVAVSDNDRTTAQWLVTRPIRAYGANGVVVLFNSVAESLQSGGAEAPSAPQLKSVENGGDRWAAPAAPSVTVRQEVRPETHYPQYVPPPSESRLPEAKWGPPEPIEVAKLLDMRGTVRETSFHQDERPAPPPPAQTAPPPEPVVQPAPAPVAARSKWREPDPEILPDLIDMRTGRPVVWPNQRPTVPAVSTVAAVPVPAPAALKPTVEEAESEPVIPVITPAEIHISEIVAPPAPVADPVLLASMPLEPEMPIAAQRLPPTIVIEPPAAETPIAAEDSGADWWSTPSSPAEAASSVEVPAGESDLPAMLRELKRAGQIGVLEIAGLPAVCIVPARKTYYSTAPVARLEAAVTARATAAFRPYPTEEAARIASDTQDSRQGSLNQLYWTAALAVPAPLPSALNEGPLRLKGWPPVNSSSGGGRYLRYATLLSGGAVSAAQLASLTASDQKEVTLFLQACNELGLLETADPQRRTAVTSSANSGKVGILRSMLAQLTPPKI